MTTMTIKLFILKLFILIINHIIDITTHIKSYYYYYYYNYYQQQ